MPDPDQLQALGQQLAAALVNAYKASVPGGCLVFLPGGVSVPNSLVQSGVINSAQMTAFLAMNFDSPFVVTSGDASVLRRDESHGSASQIYSQAVLNARPLGDPNDAVWKRIAAEIAAAQESLGPPGTQDLVCEPDDWPLSSAANYWTKFDSSQSESASTTAVVPVVNPRFWMVRSFEAAPLASPPPPPGAIHTREFSAMRAEVVAQPNPKVMMAAKPMLAERELTSVAFQRADPASIASSPAAAPAATLHVTEWRSAVNQGRLPVSLDARLLFTGATTVVSNDTTSQSSSMVVHLEHQCVTIGRFTAGQPWWNAVFLTDNGWYIPGMSRGGLLPPTDGIEVGSTYGLPIAMVVVQNLRVSGKWSQSAATALRAPGGTMGPLSLFGAIATTEADGVTVTYSHDGMQVVALLCSSLPVLPPVDTPATTP
jgi:hypothetical protein